MMVVGGDHGGEGRESLRRRQSGGTAGPRQAACWRTNEQCGLLRLRAVPAFELAISQAIFQAVRAVPAFRVSHIASYLPLERAKGLGLF
jgi:hypothetical protein